MGNKKKLSAEEFFERVKKHESVSRLEFDLGFKWDAELSAKLKTIVADLSSANLRSADLSFADLRSANLSSANLSSANLSSANLSFANLRSADLSSANLSFADLRSAKGEFFINFGVKLKVV